MTGTDTSSFFTSHQTRDVPRDQWKRYLLPGPDGQEKSWTRATTFAATLAEQYGLRIWKERQVVWGLSRRPDLLTMAATISGPEDKKALGAIVDEAHVAAGTQAKANRGTAIHRACQAAERGAWDQVPAELQPHVTKYLKAMADGGLRILPSMVERTVIVKRYGVAGTFDNLVTCPDGQIRVSDKKTGSLDYADTEFGVQLALYANADAIFDYDTGRYEPMPEVATDYAIIAHIDPETGYTELQRVNIEWGWAWARTCAEVMDIRKTKHVITPYVPEPSGGLDFAAHEAAESAAYITAQQPLPPIQKDSGYDRIVANVTSLPVAPGNGYRPDVQAAIAALPDASVTYSGQPIGTIPGGHSNAASSVNPEYQAFWSDSRHDDEPEIDDTATVNGVPLEQYGQPAGYPCARNDPCATAGTEGLHTDGTVCLSKAASTAEQPDTMTYDDVVSEEGFEYAQTQGLSPGDIVAPIPGQHESGEPTVESQDVAHAAESNVDELIARIDKLKTKALVQQVARKLMASLSIPEGSKNSIKLNKYKITIAKEIVTLAAKHGAPIPGPEDGDPDFGVPTGPAPDDDKAGSGKAADPEAEAAALHEEKIRTAVTSIRQQATLAGLQERHTYYSGTSIGWTDEMQDAARTRAAELEQSAGEQVLTPRQMIEGATSRETLSKAWAKATNNGQDMDAWNAPGPNGEPSLNHAAMSKDAQLAAGVAPSAN